jgi:hypothetical protein
VSNYWHSFAELIATPFQHLDVGTIDCDRDFCGAGVGRVAFGIDADPEQVSQSRRFRLCAGGEVK